MGDRGGSGETGGEQGGERVKKGDRKGRRKGRKEGRGKGKEKGEEWNLCSPRGDTFPQPQHEKSVESSGTTRSGSSLHTRCELHNVACVLR